MDDDQLLESTPIQNYITQTVKIGRKDTYRTNKTANSTTPGELKLKQMASYTPTDGFKDNLIVPIKQIEPWHKGTLKSKSEVVDTTPRKKAIDINLQNHRKFMKLAIQPEAP